MGIIIKENDPTQKHNTRSVHVAPTCTVPSAKGVAFLRRLLRFPVVRKCYA